MELLDLYPNAQWLPVYLPNGELTDISLQVIPKESDVFFLCSSKWASYVQAMPPERRPTLKEMADMNADLSASLIVGWTGLTRNGAPLPYSHAEAVKLMQIQELSYIRKAVEEFAAEQTNFFRPSPTPTPTLGGEVGAA